MIIVLRCAAVAAAIAALHGCALPQTSNEQILPDVGAIFAAHPTIVTEPLVSGFDTMRAALPAFHLQRSGAENMAHGEVSVIRDINFLVGYAILSDLEVVRLQALRTYLRANSAVTVRIEGYGDGGELPERDDDLSLARAQAVMRALVADIMVSNTIACVSATKPQSTRRKGSVEIILIPPTA